MSIPVPRVAPLRRRYGSVQNAANQAAIIVWYTIHWKGSIIVTTAGADQTACEKISVLQEQAKKNLAFLKLEPEEDPILHINSIQYVTKGNINSIFRSRDGKKVYNYPCIANVFKTESGPLTKEKTRDPVTCTRIQYTLCKLCPEPIQVEEIMQHVRSCQCNCDDCYKLAFKEHYVWGTLLFKK